MWRRFTTMLYHIVYGFISQSSIKNMAAIGARASIKAIKPHIPLIKFPTRGSTPASKDHATAVEKPQAFDQILNSVIAKPRTESKQGSKPLDASQIPQKYRRKLLTKEEMEIIEKGGRL